MRCRTQLLGLIGYMATRFARFYLRQRWVAAIWAPALLLVVVLTHNYLLTDIMHVPADLISGSP